MKDRAVALALSEYEAGLCPGCGEPVAECYDADSAYDVPDPIRCHSCTALGIKQANYGDPETTKVPEALRFLVRRVKKRTRPGRSD